MREIVCYAVTDTGLQRASNQDAAFAARRGDTVLLAVADGMGGAPAGERASALVIAQFERMPAEGEDARRYLLRALEAAQRAIAADTAGRPERAGMGSTVVAAVVRRGEAAVMHVGDSRAYLWRDGELRALTEDHSAAAEAVRDGALGPAEARFDPRRHLLTRVVSGTGCEPAFAGPVTLDDSSALVLVTDGVCGVLDDAQIAAAIAGARGPGVAAALIEAVHAAGAPDNAGVALLDLRA